MIVCTIMGLTAHARHRRIHRPLPPRFPMDPYRLPTSVVPTRYDLRLEPDLEAARFAGLVTIALSVREPVEEIVCNAIELEIHDAHLTNDSGLSLAPVISLDEAT